MGQIRILTDSNTIDFLGGLLHWQRREGAEPDRPSLNPPLLFQLLLAASLSIINRAYAGVGTDLSSIPSVGLPSMCPEGVYCGKTATQLFPNYFGISCFQCTPIVRVHEALWPCVCVCLHISATTRPNFTPNILLMLPTHPVTRSSCGGVMLLPVKQPFIFSCNGHYDGCYVVSDRSCYVKPGFPTSHSNERIKIQDFFSTIKTRKTHRRTKLQAPELL